MDVGRRSRRWAGEEVSRYGHDDALNRPEALIIVPRRDLGAPVRAWLAGEELHADVLTPAEARTCIPYQAVLLVGHPGYVRQPLAPTGLRCAASAGCSLLLPQPPCTSPSPAIPPPWTRTPPGCYRVTSIRARTQLTPALRHRPAVGCPSSDAR